MKRFAIFLSLFFVTLIFPRNIYAVVDPLNVANNIYGIHLADTSNLADAQKLVDSNGGSWGYVTMVINFNNRDQASWQKVFDQMRRDKLIPIIRIATTPDGTNWQKPDLSQIDSWVNFLNSLNWVTQNRYVVIGNEPNHAKEWGGTIDPAEYATYVKTFSQKLKATNSDYFVMQAGLDASATTSYSDKRKKNLASMDEQEFIREELASQPDLFNFVDGWASHSYPNPDFSGNAGDSGRGTIKTFDWELSFIKSLGVIKDFPVFITETGWVQKLAGYDKGLTQDEISDRLSYAFKNVWNDKRIVAVTPFLLDYPAQPFGNFSWKDTNGNFYKFYNTVYSLPKVSGEPVQINTGKFIGAFIFPVQLTGSTFHGFSLALNEGQSIWEAGNVNVLDKNVEIKVTNTSFSTLEPGHIGTIYFEGKTPDKKGEYEFNLFLSNAGKALGDVYKIKIIAESPLSFKLMPIFNRILAIFKK